MSYKQGFMEFQGPVNDIDLETGLNSKTPDYIKWVQKTLNRILGINLSVDGILGEKTRSAVRSFQRKYGLNDDGIIGSKTEAVLIKVGGNPIEVDQIDLPSGPFGTLFISFPEKYKFNYNFTVDDVIWTARFIVGEAQGKDNFENRAVLWAMFNRYAFFTHKYYKSFNSFIRAYSTPLQPVLKSWAAARRHMNKPSFVRTGGYYKPPHNNIPRGQLRQFLKLQSTPWNQLPSVARTLAERAMKGLIPNPIGIASEFGSTYVYFRDHYKRYPSTEEWIDYTKKFARNKKWKWIGQIPNLDKTKNTFFIQMRVSNLPASTVSIIKADRKNFEIGYNSNYPESIPKLYEAQMSNPEFELELFSNNRIEDHTNLAAKSRRIGRRDRKTVDALVLHQMACCRQRKEGGYDRIGSHYAILANGRILQLHPIEALIQASNGFNGRSVAVEFAGNFPDIKGRCWEPKIYGCNQLTQEQISAGRYLVEYLIKTINLKNIYAHRQSSASRTNDPGPDIWYNIGQWAINKYGLNDGGPGYHITYSERLKKKIKGLGDGKPIPDEWRTWGQRSSLSYPSVKSSIKSTTIGKSGTLNFLKSILGIPQFVLETLHKGQEQLAISQLIKAGQKDINKLTNVIFFSRHPERGGKKIQSYEPGFNLLIQEWLNIRDQIVRPLINSTSMIPGNNIDIVRVNGIKVSRQIAPKVKALLSAAETDGIKLEGGGFRSPQSQIELRKKHCGTTDYDIYKKPSSQCHPPTAKPGKSMHEKGLAIDFKFNGNYIGSHINPAFKWLQKNASKFGFYNLPSEPWHWSVNGR